MTPQVSSTVRNPPSELVQLMAKTRWLVHQDRPEEYYDEFLEIEKGLTQEERTEYVALMRRWVVADTEDVPPKEVCAADDALQAFEDRVGIYGDQWDGYYIKRRFVQEELAL